MSLRFGFSLMDPGAMMNEGSYANNGSGNTAPYSLAEIWQFPQAINGGGGLGLRSPQFGHGPGQFGDFAPGPNNGLGPSNTRKRRDSEDDSAKAVSTSNAVVHIRSLAFVVLFCLLELIEDVVKGCLDCAE